MNAPIADESVSSQTSGWALFDTAVGCCALAWGRHGIIGAQLPEGSVAQMRTRMQRRFPQSRESSPTPNLQQAIDAIVALLRGEKLALDELVLDMHGVPELHRRVYEITRRIRPGSTLTYGEIARQLGDASLARAVGQALGRNPFAPIVPCHRVLAAGGKAGGFSAAGGLAMKLRLLEIEGALSQGAPGLFDQISPA